MRLLPGMVLISLLFAITAVAVPNFQTVEPGLYRGGEPGVEGIRELKRMGVKTVLTLRRYDRDEAREMKRLGIRQIIYTINAFRIPDDETVSNLVHAMGNPAYRPMFVHCRAGSDRTGLLVGLYRVERMGWQPYKAFQEMLYYGYKDWLWPLNRIFERRTGYDI